MKRLPYPVEETTGRSRREFLLVGGAVVSTLSLGHARATAPKQASGEHEKIRAIMNRYGSELGHARYFEQE